MVIKKISGEAETTYHKLKRGWRENFDIKIAEFNMYRMRPTHPLLLGRHTSETKYRNKYIILTQ